jgi:hypothetical protein
MRGQLEKSHLKKQKDYQIMDGRIDGACGTQRRDEKCVTF